jgi:glycosyltransferase involved in cell wall biosynthesis
MLALSVFETDPRVRQAVDVLAERGHQVDLFCVTSPEGTSEPRHPSVNISRLRISRRRRAETSRYAFECAAFFLWALAHVTARHLRRRYDVVYVHNMPNFLVFAALVPKMGGASVVLDVHEPAPELIASLQGGHAPGWLLWLARAEERVSLSIANAVITVNESMRRRICALYPTHVPVAVVMMLPDPTRSVPPPMSAGSRNGDQLVYSGSIAYRNGVDLVVRAVGQLADEFPSLRLRVIGDGPAAPAVSALARDLGVGDRVEFLHSVPYEQLPPLLADATAGISSQRGDIFGALVFSIKVPEYVSLGLPVICSAIPTMRDYFTDDEVLFFEPGSTDDLAAAIRKALTDPEAAQERATRARQKLERLDPSAQKKTLISTVEATRRSC